MLKVAVMATTYNISYIGFSQYIEPYFTKHWEKVEIPGDDMIDHTTTADQAKIQTKNVLKSITTQYTNDGQIVTLTPCKFNAFVLLLYTNIFQTYPDLHKMMRSMIISNIWLILLLKLIKILLGLPLPV